VNYFIYAKILLVWTERYSFEDIDLRIKSKNIGHPKGYDSAKYDVELEIIVFASWL